MSSQGKISDIPFNHNFFDLWNMVFLISLTDRQTDIVDSRPNRPRGPIQRKLDFLFHFPKIDLTVGGHFFVTRKILPNTFRICFSFSGNVGATRLHQSPLFPCYSALPVDPIVEGSKEIFLFIPVWRSSWLIFWACEVQFFHTQLGATGVWKNLT